MLTHRIKPTEKAPRAVVLGSAGFVGSASVRHLRASGVETLALRRLEVDLLAPSATESFLKYLKPRDSLVFVSALAPCKNAEMTVQNLRMAEVVCEVIRRADFSHLLYVSSDAVYKDSNEPLTEGHCAEPASPHGAMHLAREIVLRSEFKGPMAILRPTLIYGLNDPHNGYGPNRFRRLAFAGSEIPLFGDGEERRDHVHVEDVGALVSLIVRHGSVGVLNAVSGEVASFREIAEFTAEQFDPRVSVTRLPRTGPMPHNGFRSLSARSIREAFPDFRITPWREGIASVCKAQIGTP